jgi:dihydrofolate synthase/folylpolyglutamate synthase
MRFKYLNDWLAWQETLNPKEIDLGLDRADRVLEQLGLSNTFNCPLITVAGTNGKGSVVATLEALAKAAGLKVCSYTSPHLFRYNERIKVDGQPVADAVLCETFERIDQARGELPLTYFEFGTLAAIAISFREQADLVVLEVGLGGRLDAVNIMDADVSVLTSVAIDHVDWLGDNREAIGFEKAGIFRNGKVVVCGETDPPQSVIDEALKKHCAFLLAGRDYDVIRDTAAGENWSLKSSKGNMANLPAPKLSGDFQKFNAATAIVALQSLQAAGLLVSQVSLADAATSALGQINLAGRFQQVNSQPPVFVDVAHNPQAALALSSQLRLTAADNGKTWAIVAMLADKDITGVLKNLSADIDGWCFAGLENTARGLSAQALFEALPGSLFAPAQHEITEENRRELALNQCTMLSETVQLAGTVEKACDRVLSKLYADDRVVIFGSFYTVAAAMNYFSVNQTLESKK